MNAIDTNLLVYTVDFGEPEKQEQASDLLTRLVSEADTVLLWQVTAEYLSCLRRFAATGRFPATDIAPEIEEWLRVFPLVSPSRNAIATALSLYARYSLSHWDSMLLAACIDAGVDTLYSEDLDAGMAYGSLTVVNPFA